ncbi:MAG TPA: hypothetical protein VM684_08260 [Gaiellales bacterium]|nr:hypothetical protein [Gaiellales bacterium]
MVLLACAGAAACGGGTAGSTSQPTGGPAIPKPVATDLAARAEAVAVSLDGQHGCAALDQARQLSTAVDAAIAAGRVPAALRPPLRATATRLVTRIRCAPPAPTVTPKPPKPDHHHHDRKHGGPGHEDKEGGD